MDCSACSTAESCEPPAMHVVLIGGSGGFGRYHLQAWRKHPRVDRLTIVGRDAERLQAVAAEFDVPATTDLRTLALGDLVDVCTPTDTHFELAMQALALDRPTIVEKPPCRTAAQAVDLVKRAGPVPLCCVMNHRFAPHWRRARELVAAGAIGRHRLSLWPVLTDQTRLMTGDDFRADAARGGGALLDGAFHLAYLVPWVLGRPIRAVTAWAGRLAVAPPAGEETGLAVWELDEGVAQLSYSWAVPYAPRLPAAVLCGDLATLLVPRSAKQPLELLTANGVVEPGLGEWRTKPRNDLANCLGHYLESITTQTGPEATWDEAVTAQRVIEATELVAREGRRMVLP